jgi:formate hydrogenlyase subunit 3/multisubunit Na+/H+ antiporter MnhD subunit
MEAIRETGRLLIILGIVLVAVGGLLMVGGRLPLRLGRLPGDIVYHGRNTTIYFPIVTSIVISLGLTLLLWLVSALRR